MSVRDKYRKVVDYFLEQIAANRAALISLQDQVRQLRERRQHLANPGRDSDYVSLLGSGVGAGNDANATTDSANGTKTNSIGILGRIKNLWAQLQNAGVTLGRADYETEAAEEAAPLVLDGYDQDSPYSNLTEYLNNRCGVEGARPIANGEEAEDGTDPFEELLTENETLYTELTTKNAMLEKLNFQMEELKSLLQQRNQEEEESRKRRDLSKIVHHKQQQQQQQQQQHRGEKEVETCPKVRDRVQDIEQRLTPNKPSQQQQQHNRVQSFRERPKISPRKLPPRPRT